MKKYLFIFIFILLFSITSNVYAYDTGWAVDKLHPVNAYITDCGANSCTTSLNTQSANIYNDDTYFFYQGTRTNMTGYGNGIMWAYLLDTPLYSGYLYSISTYICHESSNPLWFKRVGASDGLTDTQNFVSSGNVFYSYALSNLPTAPFSYSSVYQQCGVISVIFQPSRNAKYFGLNFTLTATTSSYTSALVGYEIQSLGNGNGLSTSDIQNVVNNSGLATANDINSINSSLSSIQTSINNNVNRAESNIVQNITDGVDSINDNIADESERIQQNQDANTDREIESQKVCNIKTLDKSDIFIDNNYLSYSGVITPANGFGVTDYIKLTKITNIISQGSAGNICFYDNNKTLLSCSPVSNISTSLPTDTFYIRVTISKNDNIPKFSYEVCQNGNQAMNDSINNVNDSLNNSNTSGANSDAGSFFSGFTTNNHGLTSIITKPLQFINGLSSSVCYDLSLPMPFINQNVTLPCMLPIYQQYFGSFLTLYQTITTGFIAYWVCVNIFRMVKGFKNPESDQVEVMDL